jgi:sec-independent protein translocase protein TatA
MFGGFGMTELIVILVIVIMLFGTKKLRTLGGDLGSAIKGFRKAMASEEEPKPLEDDRQEALTSTDNDSAKTEVDKQA